MLYKEERAIYYAIQWKKRWRKMVIMFNRESKSINAVFMVNILMSSKCTQSKGLGSDAYTFWHLLLSRSRNRSFFSKWIDFFRIHCCFVCLTTATTPHRYIWDEFFFYDCMQSICMENETNQCKPTANILKINRDCANAIGIDWISAQTNMRN